MIVAVKEDLDPENKDKVDKFNEKVKDIVQNIEDLVVRINIQYKVGNKYGTIMNLSHIEEETNVNLEHK